jgi:hypothetical protein
MNDVDTRAGRFDIPRRRGWRHRLTGSRWTPISH